MALPRVFIDASILILASRSDKPEMRELALAELDKDAEFLYSTIVELETLPQPTVNGFTNQVAFLRTFFAGAERVVCTDDVQQEALAEACKGVGQGAGDALHIACAMAGKATELVCAENKTNTLPQAVGVVVRTIQI